MIQKIIRLLLLIFGISTVSFAQNPSEKYEIRGKLTGIADSTWIYLEDLPSPLKTDSALIINNQFRFEGFKKEKVSKVTLKTANYSDYKFFWLENSVMTFTAEKGKFRDAVITGSATEILAKQLNDAIAATGKQDEENIKFIRRNPNTILSAYLVNFYAATWGKDTASNLYDNLSPAMKATSYGKEALEFITMNKNVKVGDHYVDFSQTNVDGKNVNLSDLKGKFILLEFWGSWCGPCRRDNPELVKIYNDFKNKGFDILGVAADSNKDAWTGAVKKDGLPWQNVCDLKGDKNNAAIIYGISYYPTNFLIDQNGIIIAKDLRGAKLRDKLTEMLK